MSGGLRLQAGGTLNPRKHIYIKRKEDAEIFRLLLEGEYVNVLTSRQMGKSSLMMRTVYRLHERGARYVTIDLTGKLGSQADLDTYYLGLLGELVRELGLELNLMAWWEEHKAETVNQRLLRFFREVVGDAIAEPVVIFLDEIESTLRLPYTDDLFTAIRGMYNERALVETYGRITFCLLGVATPNELIKDRRTTAYNVGTSLVLRDFDRGADDLSPLAVALNEDSNLSERLLDRILYWTGGHPYLTNRLCVELAKSAADDPRAVDEYVERAFASLDEVSNDVHFQQIQRFLEERLSDEASPIELYRRVLDGARVRDQTSLAHAELKLSGLVKRDGKGCLSVRNPIYRRLFDKSWVESTRPSRIATIYRQRYIAALAALAVGLVVMTIYGGYWLFEVKPHWDTRAALLNMEIVVSERKEGDIWGIIFPTHATLDVLAAAVHHIETLDRILRLDLTGTQVADVTPLQGLTNLQELFLKDTKVDDVTSLRSLTNLQELDLTGTQVANVTPLQGLTNLQRLYLAGTQVADVTPLRDLTNLQELDLWGTQVADVTPLQGLTNLQELYLTGTQIADVTPLRGLTNLQQLVLWGTQVADITPLQGLTKLQELDLTDTQVADVTPLQGLANLLQLYLARTQVADVTPLQGLTNLRELVLTDTQVADVTPLRDLTNLQRLDLTGTQVADVTPLQGLANLRELDLTDTQVADVTPLEDLTNLWELHLRGTLVPEEDFARLKRILGGE